MTLSKKAAFVNHHNPDEFIAAERHKRGWMRHSVALLVVSPRVDQIALGLPAKAADRGDTHVRVPPQMRLEPGQWVGMTGLKMARSVLSLPVRSDDLKYLGSGRGNAHRGSSVVPYGKWIHWVGVHLHDYDALRSSLNGDFQFMHWCATNHLLSLEQYAMSERKYLMTLQALAAFAPYGVEGKLTQRAHKRLSA